ncbi:preprotein translocase subunit SecF [Ruegeria sp. ANG-R]|uniref:protein translocase subunit SecF n=1 Tax=Ruegeria sp. ANG-R TaxID=1577903 RepID=UPI00057D2522|nr:protein translocase subunit SecF [Ruegeria sp. ANG-R]KIC42290.1 preprotein translocase subunit SecF [Ruegeria sp. ANG-R]
MRLKLVPQNTSFDFFSRWKIWLGISGLMMVVAFTSFMLQGLNFGIDFRGGTTIRTQSAQEIDVGAYRDAIAPLELGDVTITEIFDPTFGEDENVAMIRIQAQDDAEAVSADVIEAVEHVLGNATLSSMNVNITMQNGPSEQVVDALIALGGEDVGGILVFEPGSSVELLEQLRIAAVDAATVGNPVASISFDYDNIQFVSVESVGPKVSGELIQTAVIAVALAIGAVLVYIWLRFEWQFALGAVAALVHDVILTIGIFSELQIRFDLAIIAALLTIVGYSLNDTVVVFDRVRENLRKYKKKDLKEVLNISINETLSRTVMTSVTTLLALISLYVLGGDVIRGFVFAMIWGVIVGTYSSVFVASTILLWLGVKRDWSKPSNTAGNQFANIDA